MHNLQILSRSQLDREIGRLDVSADAKALLSQIALTSAKVGETIIYVGRQILSFIIDLCRQFPNTTFGAIAGLVITMLIGSVPFVGPALAAFVGPLLLALNIARGAAADLADGGIKLRVSAFEQRLRALESSAV